MTDQDVKLPEPYTILLPNDFRTEACPVFTAEQVRAAILAERERCAKVCEEQVGGSVVVAVAKGCAAAIRKG